MVQYKHSDQISTNIYQHSKYQLDPSTCSKDINIKPLTKNLSHSDDNADSGVTAIALPVFSYKRAKKEGTCNEIRDNRHVK